MMAVVDDQPAQQGQDPEIGKVVLFGSRWHVFGHIHREGVPLDTS